MLHGLDRQRHSGELPQPAAPLRDAVTHLVRGVFGDQEFREPAAVGERDLAADLGILGDDRETGKVVLGALAGPEPESSEEAFARQTLVPDTTAEVPCYNGGDIPYTIAWRAERIEGEAFLFARLDGGCQLVVQGANWLR